jgi:hypothetical protein
MSSSTEKNMDKPMTTGTGFAAWSSRIPRKDGLADDYKSLRDNYKYMGDAYNRRQDTADAWETKDL